MGVWNGTAQRRTFIDNAENNIAEAERYVWFIAVGVLGNFVYFNEVFLFVLMDGSCAFLKANLVPVTHRNVERCTKWYESKPFASMLLDFCV